MNKNQIAVILGVCGTLCFIGGGLSVLPGKYAVFAGIACFIIAGTVKQTVK